MMREFLEGHIWPWSELAELRRSRAELAKRLNDTYAELAELKRTLRELADG